MPDEATTHVYALLDQYIEGHQWIKNNIGVNPETGWSIDPFGHGATVPYLLARSGVTSGVVQRLHYAWKQWLAHHQWGDFMWLPPWEASPATPYLTHNQPFDIYSIKHSCGPHPYICLNFDFRKIRGEYTEYSLKSEFINDRNLKAKAELLLEQYARTGSLLPHNVALIPLGDDFRYNHQVEFDQQYLNYQKLADYINLNKDKYNAEVVFGTPRDYFKAIKERYDRFPTLKGDFFVYSDIFTEGRPAYWSGYFTTRPFLKIMDRELEHNLRNAEILFTITLNTARQYGYKNILRVLEKKYESIVKARRNLGLFQHHDAITGTSRSAVMRDYGLKLFESIHDMIKLQESCLESLLTNSTSDKSNNQLQSFILNDMERDSYDKLPRKLPILVDKDRKIVLLNSLAQSRTEITIIRVNSTNIKIVNHLNENIIFQINPVWSWNPLNNVEISTKEFEVMFVAELPPLSIMTYHVVERLAHEASDKVTTVYCDSCVFDVLEHATSSPGQLPNTKQPLFKEELEAAQNNFHIKSILPGDIQLENHKMKLLIDGITGFLKTITKKQSGKIRQCAIEFAAYQSAQLHSGAYLFKPDINTPEKDVLEEYSRKSEGGDGSKTNLIFITSGPISTQVTSIYGPFLTHTLKIYNMENGSLSDAIYIENEVDFENPPKNRETELYMRMQTDIQNGDPPEFYTDQNGFQYQKRVKVAKIEIEGNYYPITTMAFLQDREWRLTYLTTHAQGASSFEPGRLEVMLDRRTLYDDSRGMGEGLVDNRKTRFRSWLLSESLSPDKPPKRLKRSLAEKSVSFVYPNPHSQSKRAIFEEPPAPKSKENLRRFSFTNSKKVYELPSSVAVHLSLELNYPMNIFTIDNSEKLDISYDPIYLLQAPLPDDIHIMTLRTLTDSQFPQFPSRDALLVLHRMGSRCTNSSTPKGRLSETAPFTGLKVQSLTTTSLTGLHILQSLQSLRDIQLQPMELHTVNITFV